MCRLRPDRFTLVAGYWSDDHPAQAHSLPPPHQGPEKYCQNTQSSGVANLSIDFPLKSLTIYQQL